MWLTLVVDGTGLWHDKMTKQEKKDCLLLPEEQHCWFIFPQATFFVPTIPFLPASA